MPHFTPIPLDTLLPWIFVPWALVGVAAIAFFRRSRNARHKRALWIVLMIAGNVAFVAAAVLAGAPLVLLAITAAVAVVGAVRSIRRARFCDRCGGNHFPMDSAAAPDRCRHCGAALETASRAPTPR